MSSFHSQGNEYQTALSFFINKKPKPIIKAKCLICGKPVVAIDRINLGNLNITEFHCSSCNKPSFYTDDEIQTVPSIKDLLTKNAS